MNDQSVQDHIEKLVEEEHRLLRVSEEEAHAPGHHEHLEAVKVELDRYWDLLRQRRALKESGLTPGDASIRGADTVEHYQQ